MKTIDRITEVEKALTFQGHSPERRIMDALGQIQSYRRYDAPEIESDGELAKQTIERTPEDVLRFERDMARGECSRLREQVRELRAACEAADYALASWNNYDALQTKRGRGHCDSDPRFNSAPALVRQALAATAPKS